MFIPPTKSWLCDVYSTGIFKLSLKVLVLNVIILNSAVLQQNLKHYSDTLFGK